MVIEAGWANAARPGEANTAIVSTELSPLQPNDELRIELHSPSPVQSVCTAHTLGRFRLFGQWRPGHLRP